ncbi:4Fe-4S binding protein [Candidatus Amarolinea dominans]|uniref:4Fe-4S binding protein n=1 Tax=Candidatus Amarolinea dominans TaxID=3140696 RepID=UPI001DEDE532|nr:4Fe-4S binding protein [Anaerolineae bacterium]
MFGSGILKGLGVTFKHLVDTFTDDVKKIPSRYAGLNGDRQFIDQPWNEEGLFTIQYPEEKRVIPEGFRFIPMLLWDTAKSEDRCTACGICAKVCPPQCIWIVRDKDEKGKPVTRPAEFYIDASICMSCGFCAEFCPFDAIKMNHDYELATFDRYPRLIYDKETLTVPIEYYARLWPAQYQEEERVRAAEEEAKRKQAEERARAAAAKAAAPVAAAEATPSAAMAPTARPKMTPEEIEARKAEVAARRGGEASAEAAVAPTARPKMTPEEIEARKAEGGCASRGRACANPCAQHRCAGGTGVQHRRAGAVTERDAAAHDAGRDRGAQGRSGRASRRRACANPGAQHRCAGGTGVQHRRAGAVTERDAAAHDAGRDRSAQGRSGRASRRRACTNPAPAPVVPTPMAARSDELELIEGIGPKIGAAFRAAGITTFKQLAATPLERMKEILAANSLRADPSTWAEQAALAAAGRLEELKALQDQLIAGRRD